MLCFLAVFLGSLLPSLPWVRGVVHLSRRKLARCCPSIEFPAAGAGRTGRVQPGGFGWGVSGLVVVCNRDTHGANERRREVECGVVKQKSSAVAKRNNFGGGYDSQGQGIAQQPPRSPTLLQGECPSWTVVHCHILHTANLWQGQTAVSTAGKRDCANLSRGPGLRRLCLPVRPRGLGR